MEYDFKELKDLPDQKRIELDITCATNPLVAKKYAFLRPVKKKLEKEINTLMYDKELDLLLGQVALTVKKSCKSFKFSLNKNDHTKARNDKFHKSNYSRMIKLLGIMDRQGFINIYKGNYYDDGFVSIYKSKGKLGGKTTIIEITDKLLFYLDIEKVKRNVVIYSDKELIEVKDSETKKVLYYSEIDNDVIKAYNALLQKHKVTVLNHECFLYYRRIYHDSLFGSGRWYSHFQNIRSEYRKYIKLDGEQTVEIDYESMQPLLLASINNILIDDNHKVYECYDQFKGDRSELRSLFKKGFMAVLFSSNKGEAYGSVLDKLKRDTKKVNKEFSSINSNYKYTEFNKVVVDTLVEHNSMLKQFMFDNTLWKDLQYKDSSIVEYIIKEFLKLGKPVLCYHDSFVVKISDSKLLERLMYSAWEYVCGNRLNIRLTKTEGERE